jgi:hypothetical protein
MRRGQTAKIFASCGDLGHLYTWLLQFLRVMESKVEREVAHSDPSHKVGGWAPVVKPGQGLGQGRGQGLPCMRLAAARRPSRMHVNMLAAGRGSCWDGGLLRLLPRGLRLMAPGPSAVTGGRCASCICLASCLGADLPSVLSASPSPPSPCPLQETQRAVASSIASCEQGLRALRKEGGNRGAASAGGALVVLAINALLLLLAGVLFHQSWQLGGPEEQVHLMLPVDFGKGLSALLLLGAMYRAMWPAVM